MTITLVGKICSCPNCGWVGAHAEVFSRAGFEFCPNCSCRYSGFMPEVTCEELTNIEQVAKYTGKHIVLFTEGFPVQYAFVYDDNRLCYFQDGSKGYLISLAVINNVMGDSSITNKSIKRNKVQIRLAADIEWKSRKFSYDADKHIRETRISE